MKEWQDIEKLTYLIFALSCSLLSVPTLLYMKGIEEGRAASKSPHKKFGYFLSISQQEIFADIIQFVCLLCH
jgi:hypothetical protein